MRVSPSPFAHVRFGIVIPHGSSCVCISRSPMQFSHRHFGCRRPRRTSCRSSVGCPGLFPHRQFGFYKPHAVHEVPLAPRSYDSLVANLCSSINFSSRTVACGCVVIDSSLSFFGVASASLLPPVLLPSGGLPSPRPSRLRCVKLTPSARTTFRMRGSQLQVLTKQRVVRESLFVKGVTIANFFSSCLCSRLFLLCF